MEGEPLLVWHRRERRMVEEKVQDRRILGFLYGSPAGRALTAAFFSRALFSRIYATRYVSRRSARKIEPFARAFGIDPSEFEDRAYASFDDFFARRFRPGARSFATDPRVMPAFAEGRYLAWESESPGMTFPVKGQRLPLEELLGGPDRAARFRGGPVLLARLATQDYHRVHVVDAGRIGEQVRLAGALDSVNPIALVSRPEVLCRNLREVTIQETEHFGTVAYVEVGAMTVGRIVQQLGPGALPRRGDEKSRFQLGASTVLLLGLPGRWVPDPEILGNTRRGIETFVELGTPVARAASILLARALRESPIRDREEPQG